jgi:hypothetical protein
MVTCAKEAPEAAKTANAMIDFFMCCLFNLS